MMNLQEMSARRIVFTEQGAAIRESPLRGLGSDEILVRARCSLVSIGTETTLYLSSRWGVDPNAGAREDQWDFEDYGSGDVWDMERNRGFPGYALAGDVIAVGRDVADFVPGERVIALHHHADLAVCSIEPFITLKIPDGVSYEDATFSVLGSVSLHAIHRAGLSLGEDVVVFGAGLVGLLTVQLAKLAGAYPVISVDLSSHRLELASKLGADYTINPNRENLSEKVREYLQSEGCHCAIEAVGNPAVLQSCMRVCAPGARVVVMGAIVGEVSLDLYSEFIFRELTLIASQQPRNPVQDTVYYHFTGQRNRRYLLELIQRREINVRDLITHRYPYSEAAAVYRLLGDAKKADYDADGDVNRDMIGVLFDWATTNAAGDTP